ncbi:MAG: putative HTH-type transcriptional regulator [Herbinix sp.]|jgi:transcriptional regulator with XRE-family HTH domain|nr:putative HTH-type transcriptional regulator [Herbinix sp.]
MMNIGENIKKYRLKRNMTQEQLANVVGVSSQAVSKWECEDTIPDGTLFIPIADALGISLDRLCGHDKVYESDTYYGILRLIEDTPYEKRMEKAREICWHTQKGLFNVYVQADYEYQPNELNNTDGSSSVANDTGFTYISNRSELPFYSVFPEPEKGYRNVLTYDEKYRELFEAFSDSYVLKAFFYLYSQEDLYTFEKEVLARECQIPEEYIDDVMTKLCRFCFWSHDELEINGEKRTLYIVRQRYELIAVFAMLNEFIWHATGFTFQSCNRLKPYLI